MSEASWSRYDLLQATVTGHQAYGLVLSTEDGLRAFIEDAYVADGPINRDDWPEVGAELTAMVLGATRDERLRLSSRASDLELVRSVPDVSAAMGAWAEYRGTEPRSQAAADSFLATPGAAGVLEWVLKQPRSWRGRTEAEWLIARISSDRRASMWPDGLT
ncbi:hypothetical protein V1227_24415 [Lentzea sp. DG1S-22]|uniref:hypothetical protein n=1 Tax=Lentzea sp. DG1S-22 TaxID=3108822 RepID=UPI002E782272|nr:hypothetical protein [Lentzea sp. DG1S-22]WVH78225.1 hypothetical protein V1227_24415 [Lentzea sp. DG1S-22]